MYSTVRVRHWWKEVTESTQHWTEFLGQTDYDVFLEEYADTYYHLEKQVFSGVKVAHDIQKILLKDGSKGWVNNRKYPIRDDQGDIIGLFGIARDITERQLAEESLRIAATIFESQEAMMVTDVNNVILRVNRAFTNITGYSPEDVVGQTPRLFKSGKHNKSFYSAMWQSLNDIGNWEGEVWIKNKSGDICPEYLSITVVRDNDGMLTNYVATYSDIIVSQAAADEIQRLSFYDTLTHQPNRRLLLCRLNRALAASARSMKHGVLLFLDLDHFKTINDTLGPNIGDLLLQHVAARLTACVRESDTVARFGGAR
jgi:PAS domain S-box-containing protein